MKANLHKYVAALLMILFTALYLTAQRDETLVSKLDLSLSGVWGCSTVGLSFTEYESAVVAGGYGGLEFGKDFFIGWGGWSTTEDVTYDPFSLRTYRFNYGGILLGYGLSSWKVVHPQFFLLLGRGTLYVPDDRDRILVVHPSAGVEVNVLRWFRWGLQVGYRFFPDNDLPALQSIPLSQPFAEMTFRFGWSWGE